MSRISFFIYVFVITFFAQQKLFAQRIGHFDETWNIIRTEHFDIVVNSTQLDLGRYYANAAEKAYSNLSTVFDRLTNRIVIIVNDTTDVTNGYATRIPYPHIMAYSVVSGDHDSLSEAGDWPQILLTHELTHILQFEPASGFYSVLRPIFGSIVAPNMLMPAWWKEGMAVEMETQFSNTGRSRSTFQNAVMRGIVVENKLGQYDLPQSNEVLPSWPYGARPYLFGSLFFSQLVSDTKDLKSINYLAKRQGERVPYFIEDPILELNALTYETTYNKAMFTVEQTAQKESQQLKQLETTPVTFVDEKSQGSYRPTVSSAHKLYAYLENVKELNQVRIRDFSGTSPDFGKLPIGEIHSLQFHPTEKKLLYAKTDKVDSAYKLSDLHEYDLDAKKSNQLTFAGRVRSAHYSDDGKVLVYVSTFGGRTQVHTLNLENKKDDVIIASDMSSRYESALLWNNETILASKVNAKGEFSLVSVNVASKTEQPVNLQYKQIRFLNKAGNNLYFVSSENGVNNIYVSGDLRSAKPVTHVMTGLWSYDIDHEQSTIWASMMTGSGFQVVKMPLKVIEKPLPKITLTSTQSYVYTEKDIPNKDYQPEEYRAGSYLWPSYWIPFISTSSSSKGVYVQAQTTGHDPLKLHAYSAIAAYDSELNKGNFSGAYINSTQQIPFKLATNVRSFALGTNLNVVEVTTHSVGLLPDMFNISKSLALEFGAELQDTDYVTMSQHWGPFMQLGYINFHQSIFDISPLTGWGGTFRFEHLMETYEEVPGTSMDFARAQFSALGYMSSWLPSGHAIKGRLSGLATFQNVLGRYGANSTSQFIDGEGIYPQFVVRGYPTAQFFGRNIWNANFEYRFPVSTIERGSGSDAYFLKRISGAFVTDGIGVDGLGLAEDLTYQTLKADESIWSSGLELKLESTIGYILPMNFVLGYYYPHSPKYASTSQIGLSLQVGGL
jgi:hypothetical protein